MSLAHVCMQFTLHKIPSKRFFFSTFYLLLLLHIEKPLILLALVTDYLLLTLPSRSDRNSILSQNQKIHLKKLLMMKNDDEDYYKLQETTVFSGHQQLLSAIKLMPQ